MVARMALTAVIGLPAVLLLPAGFALLAVIGLAVLSRSDRPAQPA